MVLQSRGSVKLACKSSSLLLVLVNLIISQIELGLGLN